MYSDRCLPYIEDKIEKIQLSSCELIRNNELSTNIIEEKEVENYGQPERLFFNINTKDELEKTADML